MSSFFLFLVAPWGSTVCKTFLLLVSYSTKRTDCNLKKNLLANFQKKINSLFHYLYFIMNSIFFVVLPEEPVFTPEY